MAGTSDKVGGEFEKADRAGVMLQAANKALIDIGIRVTLKAPDEKKLGESLTKQKKKAQIYFTLDGQIFGVDVRVGSDKFTVISLDLDAEKDVKKHREILENLAHKTKLITEQQVWKWHEKHLDAEELSFFAGTIRQMELGLVENKKVRDRLNAFTYDTDDVGLHNDLRDFARKHGWGHYIAFLEDIDHNKDGKKIFDTYAKEGAASPVNLPKPLVAALEHDIATSGKPNWTAARKLISTMVNIKFIATMKKDRLPALDKELARLKVDIPVKRKEFVAAGGKL
jgi:hypothetical protein